VDLYHCFAQLTGTKLQEQEAPDSQPLLETLLGKEHQGRSEMVLEGMQYKKVFRDQRYAYIPPHDDDFICQYTGNEKGNLSRPQLYDLHDDLGQLNNLAELYPEKVTEFAAALERHITTPRTSRLEKLTSDFPLALPRFSSTKLTTPDCTNVLTSSSTQRSISAAARQT